MLKGFQVKISVIFEITEKIFSIVE